jgi:hypothetical protein
MPSADTDELAKFGYKQELDRSLGLFSSFAAGFSYISIMTGVFELFFFGFFSGGPYLAWPRPAVYGADHWYYQWGAFVFVIPLGAVGAAYYFFALRGRLVTVLAEHRAGPAPAPIRAVGEEA